VTNSNGVNPGIVDSSDNGNIAILPQLQIDLNAAYLDLLNRPAPATPLTDATSARGVSGGTFTPPSPDLSGFVLSPGIYTATGTYGLSNTAGSLVLDAGGNPGAVFIIRSTAVGPSGLTSTTGSVVLRNGARPTNVFWLVDNATIGAGTFFQGTVVAGSTITLNAGANVEGRMLAGGNGAGAITLTSTNIVAMPLP
jgi:type VI secretion system secreted protein VgrG